MNTKKAAVQIGKPMILAMLAWLALGCGADSAADKQGDALTKEESEVVGSYAAPMALPAEDAEANMLAQHHWVFEFYVTEDAAARQFNRGRWYRFQMDGTFTSGHWEEQTGVGTWALNRDYEREIVLVDADTKEPISSKPYDLHLLIDSQHDDQDADFIITFNSAGDQASWVAASGTSKQGLAIKAINLIDRPTKKQFGLE